MLTKILVTALVIFACYLFIRYKRGQALPAPARPKRDSAAEQSAQKPIRMLALGLCLVSLLASGAFLGFRWWDDQRLLQVRVINADNGEVVEYQAYKGDVEGRSFITIYGQQVSIAASERMEISPVMSD
ncbi:hypothetical protein DV711_08125 [Motiliproteus coralliicola]|uniref:Antitermination protein NusG n=1 Tax=Motiliproteus coralliicola TaxID=2283196 RepID=A0A369WNA3_9GAMM|nr:hypothetical protein [Motiliproteus coralliicola]RDE22549.1 hypothetical protein DV711_08125 [Motiliproteus coralliicola]